MKHTDYKEFSHHTPATPADPISDILDRLDADDEAYRELRDEVKQLRAGWQFSEQLSAGSILEHLDGRLKALEAATPFAEIQHPEGWQASGPPPSRQQDLDTPDPQPAQDREVRGFEVFDVLGHEPVKLIRLSDALARIAEVEGERDYWKEHAANRLRHGVEFRAERDEARAEVERLRAECNVWRNEVERVDTQPPAPVRGPSVEEDAGQRCECGHCIFTHGARGMQSDDRDLHCRKCDCEEYRAPAVRGPDGPVTVDMVKYALEDVPAWDHATGAKHLNAALAATPTGAGGRVRVSQGELATLDREIGRLYWNTNPALRHELVGEILRTVLGDRIEIADALEQGQEVDE